MPAAGTRQLVLIGTLLALVGVVIPAALGVHLHALGVVEAAYGAALLVCCSALALNGSRATALAPRQALPAVLATTAANAVTPAGIGGALLVVRLHRRSGLTSEQAVAAAGLRSGMGALTATAATILVASSIGTRTLPHAGTVGLVVVIAGLLALAGALAIPSSRSHVVVFAKAVFDVARRPRCLVSLLVGCVGVTAAQLITLHGAVHAVGGHLPWMDLLAALMGSAAAKSAVPSPGGVGPVEAALVGGLAALGMGLGVATAAVAVYRTIGHWLPVLGGVASLRDLRRQELV